MAFEFIAINPQATWIKVKFISKHLEWKQMMFQKKNGNSFRAKKKVFFQHMIVEKKNCLFPYWTIFFLLSLSLSLTVFSRPNARQTDGLWPSFYKNLGHPSVKGLSWRYWRVEISSMCSGLWKLNRVVLRVSPLRRLSIPRSQPLHLFTGKARPPFSCLSLQASQSQKSRHLFFCSSSSVIEQ